MQYTFLKAKLHQARVTQCELEYEGSCSIDAELLAHVGIHEFEQIQIYNIENGIRLTTYAILAPSGSRMIGLNGAAAHAASPGDRVIICSYVMLAENEIHKHKPHVLQLDQNNEIKNNAYAITT